MMMTRALASFDSAHNADVSHTANSNTQLMLLYEANEWTKNINVETSSYTEWTQKI